MTAPGLLVEIKKEGGEWLVIPGDLHAKPGDVITWRAIGTNAQIWFPQPSCMVPASLALSAGSEDVLSVSPGAADGPRPYVVYCELENCFAHKSDGSEPVVIIP